MSPVRNGTTNSLKKKLPAITNFKQSQRKYREDRYENLLDAVYARRGWTKNGVPTIEHLKDLGMDLPELIEVVKKHLS